ncbi:calcium-transporting ATPase 12, plasma membrane-type-like protein [Tanacetum coccineum]
MSSRMMDDQAMVGLDNIEDESSVDAKVLELYHQGVGLNTTSSVYSSGTTCEYSGSPTEKAILPGGYEFGGVSVKKNEDNTVHVHWKGAVKMVLAMCLKYYQKDGIMKSMNQEDKSRIENLIQGMAASSLRPGAKEAIDACRSAGVGIKMITGVNVFTAKAIATECGILEAGQQVDGIKVMARSSPFDKLLMVQCLKKKGHVVAVTGDGTNDAPTLKEAYTHFE